MFGKIEIYAFYEDKLMDAKKNNKEYILKKMEGERCYNDGGTRNFEYHLK